MLSIVVLVLGPTNGVTEPMGSVWMPCLERGLALPGLASRRGVHLTGRPGSGSAPEGSVLRTVMSCAPSLAARVVGDL